MYDWNPAYKWLIGIKNEYIGRFGREGLYNAGGFRSFVNKWVSALYGHEESSDNMRLLRCLIVNTTGTVANLHYNTIAVSKICKSVFPEKGAYEAYAALWDFKGGFLQKCRSVCIDAEHEEIVIAAYDKFFNINEMPWTQLDEVKNEMSGEMEKAEADRVLELSDKLDGSFMAASWHYGQGAVGISSSGDYNSPDNKHIGIAKEYIDSNIMSMITENKDLTFMFELLDSRIPIVIRYPESMRGLHLIGIRDKNTGETYLYKQTAEFARLYGARHVPVTDMADINELVERAAKISGVEGWVLNIGGRRYKLKSRDYLNIAHIMTGDVVGANVIKCYCENTADDFVSRLPQDIAEEFFEKLEMVKQYEETMLQKLETCYKNADKSSRAAFAKWCVNEGMSGLALMNMFKMFEGKEPHVLYAEIGKERKYIKFEEVERLAAVQTADSEL